MAALGTQMPSDMQVLTRKKPSPVPLANPCYDTACPVRYRLGRDAVGSGYSCRTAVGTVINVLRNAPSSSKHLVSELGAYMRLAFERVVPQAYVRTRHGSGLPFVRERVGLPVCIRQLVECQACWGFLLRQCMSIRVEALVAVRITRGLVRCSSRVRY